MADKNNTNTVIVANNSQNENDGLARKAAFLGLPYLSKAPESVPPNVISTISKDVAQKHQMVAFEKSDGILKVAMTDPQNIDALNSLRFIAEKEKLNIQTYLVSEKVFSELFNFYISSEEMIKEAVKSLKTGGMVFEEGDKEKQKKKEEEILKEAPVAKVVQVIISHAIEGKSSDIHIEPMEKDYRVRFRIDGVLHTSIILPKEIGPVVVARIKILANLKIDEKRKPQDGRFRITESGKEVDFRVSVLPVINGEKVVLRILDKESGIGDIKSLGLMGTALDNTLLALKEAYGMILMTGPTGSGKSTTLYALLKILNGEDKNIITLEDPIEYNIEGLNQSQIIPEIGYTFANGLRSILRQDPNVVMVGEIRDTETAELAIHAALTGHLMFSTLHTNTAIGAIPRLIDMNIEPFLLASSLRIVMAQRLVRKICPNCKEEEIFSESIQKAIKKELEKIPPKEIAKYEIDLSKGIHFYRGKGCDKCQNKGLKGRIAIFEAVPINNDIKSIITENSGEEGLLTKEVESENLLTMKQDGILKALRGDTTLEEVERVTEGTILLEEQDE